jgi:hypothetical protein
MIEVENVYTSVSANRTPLVLDWGQNKLISFGAANSVVILNPEVSQKNHNKILILIH